MTAALIKDTFRTIRKSFSRYLSILLIVALGTSFFVGIKATAPDMFATAKKYYNDNNLMDIRIQSAAGLTDSDVSYLMTMQDVQYVSGQKFTDALVRVNGEIESDIDGTQLSARAYSISPDNISDYLNGVNDGTYINRPELIKGRYPTTKNECLVDDSELSTPDSYKIGSVITLSDENGLKPDTLNTAEFTVVGIIRSPYYVSFERGNTTIGSGKLGTYIYIPEEAFESDYYSEIYLTVTDSGKFDPYSDEYFDFIKPYTDTVKAVSEERTKLRVDALRPELEQQMTEAQVKIDSSSEQVNAAVAEIDATITELSELVTNGQTMITEAELEIAEKFAGAQSSADIGSAEYQAAIAMYSAQRAEYDRQAALYSQKEAEYWLQKDAYDEVYEQCQQAKSKLENAQTTVATTQSLITAGEAVLIRLQDAQANAYNNDQIQSIVYMMQATYPELYNSVKALTAGGLATEIAASLSPYIEQQKAVLAQQQNTINTNREKLELLSGTLEDKKSQLSTAALELATAKSALESANNALNSISSQLTSAGFDIQSSALQIQIEKVAAETKLSELKAQVAAAPDNLLKAQQKKAEIIAGLDNGLAEAQQKLNRAKKLYSGLDGVSWNVTDRNGTPGFSSYGQSVKNIELLSDIFPIFFFVLASLICLTTMKRMVEEDRTVLGTYKALGYESNAIVMKYVIYSLSACVIGSAAGIGIGVFTFPYAINKAYGIMYSMPELTIKFPVKYALIGFGISIACTVLTTVFAIFKELRTAPAILMRPRSPKGGKRILLEKVRFFWKRLSFTSKVTARNLFRNKQRFTMTMFGIAGCCALLLSSLGMYNSINDITEKQYGSSPVSKYDFQLVFSELQHKNKNSADLAVARADVRIESLMLTAMKSMTGGSARTDKTTDVYVLVPEDEQALNSYIDLRDRVTKTKYVLDDTGAIITEKLAKDTKTEVGDEIIFTDSDGKSYSVTVSAIAENYTFNYIYMTAKTYKAVTGKTPQYYYALGRLSQTAKTGTADEQENTKGLLATDLMKLSGITAVAYTSEATEEIGEITNALSLVIMIFFVSALVLAFVVLYNLSNVNIIERTRELATLKVLGFVDSEVSRYIYRENIIVSLFGIAFGTVLGIGLHYLLITFTAIDTVMYGQSIAWYSYLIALAVTVLIIFTVNLILHHKLKKIDMVLSLKSVE